MAQFDRDGTFRGKILEKAVGTTKKGYPQLVLSLQATQYFDETEKEWVEGWEEFEQEIMAFLCLVDGKGETTLNFAQIQKVFGWNGRSFAELDAMPFEKEIQFRLKSEVYEGVERRNVAWLDEFDAVPGNIVKKLDTQELKDLDTKFAAALQKSRKPDAPTSAKKAPAPPTKTMGAPPETKAPKAKTPAKETKKAAIKSDKLAAWEAAVAANLNTDLGAGLSEKALSDIWVNTITEIAGDVEEEDITPEQWGTIQNALEKKLYKF